ncbi:MAG: ATP-dependent Clp protease proteolytic subunit [Bacteroidales bacterium]
MKFLLAVLLAICFNVQAETIVLSDQNTLSLNGPVDGGSMTALMVKLQELNKIDTKEPIFLVLNSPGGSIYDGFDFIRFAKTSKRSIETVTIFAASMAFQIVESLGTRNVTSYSTLMSHRAAGGISGIFPGPLDTRYAHVLSHIREQDELVVSRTKGKQTLESYSKLIQNEYWADSKKAIVDGFADKEVDISCDKSLQGSHSDFIDLGFFAVNVEFANCPLITSPISISPSRGFNYIETNKIDVTLEFRKLFDIRNVKL